MISLQSIKGILCATIPRFHVNLDFQFTRSFFFLQETIYRNRYIFPHFASLGSNSIGEVLFVVFKTLSMSAINVANCRCILKLCSLFFLRKIKNALTCTKSLHQDCRPCKWIWPISLRTSQKEELQKLMPSIWCITESHVTCTVLSLHLGNN